MFSGGKGSWAAAKRAVERYGPDDVILLFADTLVEDAGTYKFLDEAAVNVGAELVRVADGRTPFEVFHDDRFLGNARLANCSKYLKQKPCRTWLEANADEDTVVAVGIDWTELHRLPAIVNGWKPWTVWAPMVEAPLMDGPQVLDWLAAEGIEPPAAYAEGFPHANCMAQGCVRGGQAYWENVLRKRPEAFAYSEREEQKLRGHLGADVAMLRDRHGGVSRPLPLADFRARLETQPDLFDGYEWGGCGCFTEDGDAA
jgi:3'-phosphoadenosine 5'-phosphosulfate sulfotransferase (PAPS reductase)/FAD synthetase